MDHLERREIPTQTLGLRIALPGELKITYGGPSTDSSQGGTEESYTLNFSRPGAQIIAQYYNLIHLGFNGFRDIMENALKNARLLSKSLEATGWYRCVSDIHRPKGVFKFDPTSEVWHKEGETSADYNAGLPVVAFTFSDDFKKEFPHVKQESVSTLMRVKQYIIPSESQDANVPFELTSYTDYPLPPNEESTEILRVVVRESMSLDLLDRLITDLISTTQTLMESDVFDLSALQPVTPTVEKTHASKGVDAKHRAKHGSKRPMHHGVHRAVC